MIFRRMLDTFRNMANSFTIPDSELSRYGTVETEDVLVLTCFISSVVSVLSSSRNEVSHWARYRCQNIGSTWSREGGRV